MGTIVEFLEAAAGEPAFASSVLLRGTALLALAFLGAAALKRWPAALRHHLWATTMAGLIALPLLTAALPGWRVALPIAAPVDVGTAPAGEAGPHAAALPTTVTASDAAARGRVGELPGASGNAGATSPLHRLALDWPRTLLLAWAAGFLLLVGRLGLGLLRAARLVRRAEPVTDRRWNVLVSLLSLRAELASSVRVVTSDEVNVPMAWGLSGAWLVLPRGIEEWPEDRRRVVVLHELAHLRRRDCLVQALAELALAFHWPNPLAWVATSRMRAEREQACDDAVLVAGVGGPAYAHHLVEIARGLARPARTARAAVAMARPSELENRVLAILDERRRRGGLGRRAAGVGLAAVAALLLPLASIRPAPAAVERAVAVESAGAGEELGPEEAEADAASGELGAEASSPAPLRAEPQRTEPQQRAEPQEALPGDTIEDRVFEVLERALRSEDADIRRQVANTLGMMESPRGVEPLVRLVQEDADPDVRKEAVWALGMIESERGVQPLLPLLEDPAERIRKETAWALGMIESEAAVEALGRAFGAEEAVRVRAEIVWALGMIEDRAALETVADALEDPEPEVRKQALWALGMIMD